MSDQDSPDFARRRHGETGAGPDADRTRYFTQTNPAGGSSTRHRRRRADGDTSVPIWQTGQVPRVTDDPAPRDERTGRAMPTRVGSDIPPLRPFVARSDAAGPNIRKHTPTPEELAGAAPTRPVTAHPEPDPTPSTTPISQPSNADDDFRISDLHGDDHDVLVADDLDSWKREFTPAASLVEPDNGHHDEPHADTVNHDEPMPTTKKSSKKRRRRMVLAAVLAVFVVMLAGVGYYGLRMVGVFGASDYTNQAGTGDVLVTVPDNATLSDFGQILVDKDVVGSVRAFTKAADGKTLSAGIYKLRTGIPATKAVSMLDDGSMVNRVGRVVIPEGVQLDSKTGIDKKVTPGIFQLVADATETTVNGTPVGVTPEQLSDAAKNSSPQDLGVPQWAKTEVAALDDDHRKIEGLIAPGTWEAIDPTQSPTEVLKYLVTQSAKRYEGWGLLSSNSSKLSPYQTLVAASVVEREVRHPEDFPKVSRVILNRLDANQRLEMDSTANYTAEITNIDVHGDAYKADNKWNTYRVKGLPPTPIAAVGKTALTAMESPTPGNWLYFITVDNQGTTLFSSSFEEHKRNRGKACANKFLTTGCN